MLGNVKIINIMKIFIVLCILAIIALSVFAIIKKIEEKKKREEKKRREMALIAESSKFHKNFDMEDALETFRENIVFQLKSIAVSDRYDNNFIRNKGYYESIRKCMMDGLGSSDEILEKYDLCFQTNLEDCAGNCWHLLDKIIWKDDTLLFGVYSFNTLPPDYGFLFTDSIPTKILYKALKMFLNENQGHLIPTMVEHIDCCNGQEEKCNNSQHIEHDINTEDDDNLTIDKIMDYIRKDGYSPQKLSEKAIAVEIQGGPIVIYYNDGFFKVGAEFYINKEYLPAAEKAAFATMASIRLIRIFTHIEDNDWLITFEATTYVASFSAFETLFSHCIDIFVESINRHKDHFNKIAEKSVKEEAPILNNYFPNQFFEGQEWTSIRVI